MTSAPGPESRARHRGVGLTTCRSPKHSNAFRLTRSTSEPWARAMVSAPSLNRSARLRPGALRRCRRATDRQPARTHRRATLRRPRGAPRPARPALVSADHYVVRMLYSQGIARASRAWQDTKWTSRAMLASCSPTDSPAPVCVDADRGLWLRETLATDVRDRGTPRLGHPRRCCTRISRNSWPRPRSYRASFSPDSDEVSVDDRRGRRIAWSPSRPRRVKPQDPPDVTVPMRSWRSTPPVGATLSDLEVSPIILGAYSDVRHGARRAPRRCEAVGGRGWVRAATSRRHFAPRRP